MAMIKAPDSYYCGTVSAGGVAVAFRAGVAETDDQAVIAICRDAGHEITDTPSLATVRQAGAGDVPDGRRARRPNQ